MASIAYRIKKFWRKVTGNGDVAGITSSLDKMVQKLEAYGNDVGTEVESAMAQIEALIKQKESLLMEQIKASNAAKKIQALFEVDPIVPVDPAPAPVANTDAPPVVVDANTAANTGQ